MEWLTRKESVILNNLWYSQKLLSSIWLDSSKIISILSSFIHSLLLLPSYPRGPYRNLHRSEDKDIYCTAWDILVVENFIIYNISVPHFCKTLLPLSRRHTLSQRERLIQAFDSDADFSPCYFRHIVSLNLKPQFKLRSSILVSFFGWIFTWIWSIT